MSRYEELNTLYLKQTYFLKKIQEGNIEAKTNLNLTNLEIKQWFTKEAESTILLINAQEIEENETLNLYHHDVHNKKLKISAIISLETPNGPINGHEKCADFISNLLKNEFQFNTSSQKILLNEVDTVFTEEENTYLMKILSKSEIEKK